MKHLLRTLCLTSALHAQQPAAAPQAIATPATASPTVPAKPLGRGAVTISNPTVLEVTMTTTFVVPAANDRINRVRVFHALPTVMPWGLSEPRFGAANVVSTPSSAEIKHHKPSDSHYVLWVLNGAQTPGTRSTFTTKMTIKSADRNVGPEADKITWSDYDRPPEDPSARVEPEVAQQVHPELAAVAAKIRAENPPAAAVRKICQWVSANIKYDASMQYGWSGSDIESIVRNKKGHCGHRATVFEQLTASAGIPMRRVGGMILNSPNGRKGRLLAIRADWTNTHQWTEVYLPTIGWVEAEPSQGLNAFAIPAHFVQNNRSFQNYAIWIREGSADKPHRWKPREGGFSSDYGVENIIDFSSKPAVD